MIYDLVKDNATVSVSVSYPDGKNSHTTTVKDVWERFHDEGKEWKDDFFTNLLIEGEAFTRFGGHYKINIS